jgi:hypothetical protein
VKAEAVWVSEDYLCERCSSSWVVNDVLDNTTDVAMAFREVELTELGRSFVKTSVRSEDRASALPLVANNFYMLVQYPSYHSEVLLTSTHLVLSRWDESNLKRKKSRSRSRIAKIDGGKERILRFVGAYLIGSSFGNTLSEQMLEERLLRWLL